MAKSHGSVRMGPISLFTLIIILCLAVMAVLAVTTAQASRALVQRQADATNQVYADEIAGQTFLAELDGALATVRAGSPTLPAVAATAEGALDSASAAAAAAAADQGMAVAVQADMLSGADVTAVAGVVGVLDLPAEPPVAVADVQQGAEAVNVEVEGGEPAADASADAADASADTGVSIEDDTVSGKPATSAYNPADSLVAVHVVFETEGGRTLDAVVLLNADGTYRILSWKTTTQWNEEGSGDVLWTGVADLG